MEPLLHVRSSDIFFDGLVHLLGTQDLKFLPLVNSLSYESCWEGELALTIKLKNTKHLFSQSLLHLG